MDELQNYLRNHWAAAAAGADLASRVARTHRGSDVGDDLASVAAEIAEDRRALRDLMVLVDARPEPLGPLLARAGERLGRLKPNGRLVGRSPVSDVLEIEALRTAVAGKRAGWDALRVLSAWDDRLDDGRLQELQVRAEGQVERLARVHTTLVASRWGPTSPSRDRS